MKLEVEMYVRTNDGYINKIKKVNQFNVLIDGRDLFGEELNIPNNEITKASYNIIDILEVGDYVNGQKIYYDEELDFLYVQSFDGDGEFYQESITKQSFIDNIKTVITHEQMEQMAYKVGD